MSAQTAQQYAESLRTYAAELARDPYVLAAAVYQFGGNPDWESFEALGEPALESLLLAPSVATGPITIEEGTIVRTPDQQNAIDVVRGWAGEVKRSQLELLTHWPKRPPQWAKAMNMRLAQAHPELFDVATRLESEFPFP